MKTFFKVVLIVDMLIILFFFLGLIFQYQALEDLKQHAMKALLALIAIEVCAFMILWISKKNSSHVETKVKLPK